MDDKKFIEDLINEKREDAIENPLMHISDKLLLSCSKEQLIIIVKILDKMTTAMSWDIFSSHLYNNPGIIELRKLKIAYLKDVYKKTDEKERPKEPVEERVVHNNFQPQHIKKINQFDVMRDIDDIADIRTQSEDILDKEEQKRREIISLFDEIMNKN